MNHYSRMFLHFLHAVTNDRDRVTVLVFGTRLTNITRQLRHRDVDVAMARVAEAIKDWSGGTRIGASLREFNFKWARRTLGQNACVLLVSDGLDREAGEGLGEEMERLAKSCHRLVWLNPLLRYEKFEARPAGVRAMLPHVDLFLPVHNLKSLVDLAKTDRKSTRLNSSHSQISYAVFCLKKKKIQQTMSSVASLSELTAEPMYCAYNSSPTSCQSTLCSQGETYPPTCIPSTTRTTSTQ